MRSAILLAALVLTTSRISEGAAKFLVLFFFVFLFMDIAELTKRKD